MREVRQGVWHWEAMHPEWGQIVSSYAIDDGERLLVFDPLSVPAGIEAMVGQRETAIFLTCPWHHRDGEELAPHWAVPLYRPPLEEGDDNPFPAHEFRAGETLDIGVQAYPGREANDLVLWVQSHGALVFGDTLVDRGNGLEFPRDWVPDGVSPDDVLASLRPLLHLPVEIVLATHGGPTDRAALEQALA